MRHLILIFMIALLPLRGWAVESMSISMAVQQLSVAEQAVSVTPVDCPMLTGTVQVDQDDSATAPLSPLCKGCTTCQLCMALASGQNTVGGQAVYLPAAAPVSRSFKFASADSAPGLKPPIF